MNVRWEKIKLKRATSATAVEISRRQSRKVRQNVENVCSNEMWKD